MRFAKVHKLVICLLITSFLGAGCGGIGGAVMPQPGATISGPMEVNNAGEYATAGAGELEITITADGAGIASAGYSLRDTWCSNVAGSVTIESGGFSATLTPARPVEIIDGSFEFNLGDLDVSGEFTSPTEAAATIRISTEESVRVGLVITCDFGSWTWSGTAE